MPATDQEALLLQFGVQLRDLQKQMNSAVGVVSDGGAKMVLKTKEAMAEIEKTYGTVDAKGFRDMLAQTAATQDKLTAAQAAGNTAEAKALREQLVLQQAVQKAATLQIETQLAIAKAAGSRGQVAQLTEALALQGQLNKLQGVGLVGTKALVQAEAAVNGLAAAEKAAEGASAGRALNNVFDRSRLAVIEEGTAKVPIFGSAVEALGVAGFAAAAGLVALGIGAEQAHKAMEWADTLQKTADGLGVTTDSLQKLDYAAVASSLGVDKGRETLANFNQLIGKFETNTAAGRINKWAAAIKLSRDEVNATVDPVEKLQLVMEKIATLRDAQSRSAAAKAFGLDGFLPLIQQGAPAIDAFVAKMREAQAVGGVIGAEDIRRAAEMNDKVEALSYLIGQHFRQSFIDAAPAIEKVAEFIERCVKGLADLIGSIPDAIRGLESLISKIPHLPDIKIDASGLAETTARALGFGPVIDVGRGAAAGYHALAERGRAATYQDPDDPEVIRNQIRSLALSRQGKGEQLTFDKPKKAKKGPTDDTAQKTDQVAATLDGLDRQLLQAMAALLTNVETRAVVEKQIADAEAAQQKARLDKQIADIAKDKGLPDATKRRLTAELELGKVEVDKITVAKDELIDRQKADALARQALKSSETALQGQDQILALQDSLATTASQRRDIELKRLDLADQMQALELQAVIDSRLSSDVDKQIAQAKLDQLRATKGLRQQQVLRNTEGPGASYLRSLDHDTSAEGFETAAVNALKDLNDQLDQAIEGTESLGDAFKHVAATILASLIDISIKENIITPLAHQLFGGGGGGGGGGTSGGFGGGGIGNFISSIFGGGSGSSLGSSLSGSTDFEANLASGGVPGFAGGGSFIVGGMSGIDRNLVQLRASRGERISIETPEQQAAANAVRGGGPMTVIQHIITPDADSFRKSARQIASATKRGLAIV
jgi:hypothetical protein